MATSGDFTLAIDTSPDRCPGLSGPSPAIHLRGERMLGGLRHAAPIGESSRTTSPGRIGRGRADMHEWAVSIEARLADGPDEDLVDEVAEYFAPRAGAVSYRQGRLGVTFTLEAPTAAAAAALGIATWKRSPIRGAEIIAIEVVDLVERDTALVFSGWTRKPGRPSRPRDEDAAREIMAENLTAFLEEGRRTRPDHHPPDPR